MNITRTELARLGARPAIRRHPRLRKTLLDELHEEVAANPVMNKTYRQELARLGRKAQRPRHRDPSMAPTRGLTPANTVPGPKAYVYFAPTRVAVATWTDARDRVPVTWITYDRWRATRWPDHDRAPGRAS